MKHITQNFGWMSGIGIFACLFFVIATINFPKISRANNARIINIYSDGREITTASSAGTVGEVLDRAGIVVNERDLVEPSRDTVINTDTFNINIFRSRPVTIIDGQSRLNVVSAHQSPRSIIEAAGVEIYNEDWVNLERVNDFVGETTLGLKLVIDRATPVTLNLYGNEGIVRTHAKTVGDLLSDKQIKLREGDMLYPDAGTILSQDMKISIISVGSDVVTAEEPIKHKQEVIYDTSQPVGYRQVQTEGEDGLRLVSYKIVLHNGVEVDREEVQSVVLKEPKTAKVVLGTKTEGFSGAFADALAVLRSCEGSYTSVNSIGYYGAYQFSQSTWAGAAPSGYENVRPDQAPPTIQDQAAANLYQRRGWSPWPACSAKLGLQDIYR
ncbi:DUF348 domain-containing protein [Candidatus Saccharibacteria bacterium CPR2]|nr:DUF348 domain-containing protein [Candidatus Saccharibacteria bacterium CPR2]